MTESSTSTVAPKNAPSRFRSAAKVVAGLALLGVVFYFVGRQLLANFRQIDWAQIHVSPLIAGLCLAVLLGARLMNALNCRFLLEALGTRLSAGKVIPVVWLASLGRYIPGKMAVVAGSVVMLARLGVRVPVAMAALFLSGALMILIGLMTATPLLFGESLKHELPYANGIALVVLALGLLCLYPPIFLKLCNRALDLLKRQRLPAQMRMNAFFSAIGLTLLRSGLLGLGLWLAARAIEPIGIRSYPLALASAGLASVIGFLAVFAPAGVGVHEGVYLITMQPLLGPKVGLLVVLFRAFHVLADAIAGAVAALMLRSTRRTIPEPPIATAIPNAAK